MLAHPNGVVRPSAKEPLFSFGVIADVQYADIPDGRSFLGVPRYYRHSIAVLRRAVQRWNGDKSVRFCINFGDIVDGFCPKDRSLAAVQAVVREFDNFRGGPAYHMLGNHCLYNLPRSELVSVLRMPSASPGRAYYDFSPWSGYRFVVLDAYDFSAVGWPRGHPVSFAARRFLEKRNPNHDKNSPSGLAGTDRRFVMFNGEKNWVHPGTPCGPCSPKPDGRHVHGPFILRQLETTLSSEGKTRLGSGGIRDASCLQPKTARLLTSAELDAIN